VSMTTGLTLGLLVLTVHAAAGNAARGYLKLASAYEADCVILQGRMRQLVNTSPDRAIEVYLYRYMGETQQPGRRVEIVPPGGKSINLGCTHIAGGGVQDWKIIEARFQK
jgi:hypothetical protein